LAAICAAFALPTSGAARGEPPIRETVLSNGLKVLTKELRAAPVVTVWTLYRVGSRNEPPGMTGISHLLEHMLFRSTKDLKTGEIDRLVQLAGGRHNAFTSYDYTAYHITLPSDRIETALRIESDRMLNCALDTDELRTELGVVLSELQGRLNDPEEQLEERTRAAAFIRHPYRNLIIGWKADVESLTRETVVEYYRTHYQPNNAVLVIVGDIQAEATLDLVRKYFGGLPSGPTPPPVTVREPPRNDERRVAVKGAGSTGYLQVFFDTPAGGHPDHYPLVVLEGILTQGKSARLYKALVETDLAAAVSSDYGLHKDPAWFALYLTARAGIPHQRLEDALFDALERIRTEGVTERELQKAINQVRAGMTMEYGSVSGLARAIGQLEMTVGYREFDRVLDKIRQVSVEDVRRVARTYFDPHRRTVGWLVPDGGSTGPKTPTGGRGYIHRSSVIPAGVEAAVGPSRPHGGSTVAANGKVARYVFPNGLTLIAAENRVARSLAIKGYVLAGPVEDPQGKSGLATLTAELVTRGTAAHSAAELAERIEFLGATTSIRAERETVGITAQMLTEHFDVVLGYLAECLRTPAFPPDEVQRVVRQLAARLDRETEDSKAVARRALFAHLFPPAHPLHRDPTGRRDDVDTVQREDVVQFHAKFYSPERTVLVVAGDRTPDEIRAAVGRAFGDWKPAGVPFTPRPPMPVVSAAPRRTAIIPGKSEAIVMLGGNGITRDHPDYYAAFLANRILGGSELNSRLMKALRQDGGMTYGVYSYFHPVLGERPWVVSFQTGPAMVDRAIDAVAAEVSRLREHGVTAEELEESRAAAIGSLVLSMEDQMGMAFVLRDTELFDLGIDFPFRFPADLRAVTPAQAQAAARKYLHPDRIVQIVVTPPLAPR
jgi:zinc protease